MGTWITVASERVAGPSAGVLPRWRLRLVGVFAVFGWGRPPAVHSVAGRKARMLLALLAVRHRQLVTGDRITEALWPDRPPRRPEEGIATLVSRLRRTLGAETVLGGRAGYRLGDLIQVDLHEAGASVRHAEARLAGGRPADCLLAARRALELLDGGPVLADDPSALWAEPARALQAGLLRRGRHAAAEAALRTAEPHRAQRLAAAAITADPLDEAGYRLLIRAHAAAGEPAMAAIAYRHLRITLATELGIDPAPPTRDLYHAVLRQAASPLS